MPTLALPSDFPASCTPFFISLPPNFLSLEEFPSLPDEVTMQDAVSSRIALRYWI